MRGNYKYEHQKEAYTAYNNPNWRGGKEVPCSQCGKEIWRKPSEFKRSKNFFCSPECHDKFRVKPKVKTLTIDEMHGENHPRWAGAKYCKICGVELLTREKRRANLCSENCTKEANHRRGVKVNEKRKVGGQYFCKFCNKEMTMPMAHNRTFCSRVCFGAWVHLYKSGENSSQWHSGANYQKYPPEFNYQLRLKVRRRDNFTCQSCGLIHKGTGPEGRGLLVHHIDRNKNNNSIGNLLTLCNSCHRKLHWEIWREEIELKQLNLSR